MPPPQDPGSDATARHICSCGKSFTRKEHLTRHQANHDKLAFACNVCQRRFSRKDLLRRHSLIHEEGHTRAVISCDACRANKTKCSGDAPCLLCARRGIECVFRSGPHPSNTAASSDGPTDTNAAVDESDDANIPNQQMLVSYTDSRPEDFLGENALHTGKQATRNVELIQGITIIPSGKAPESGFQPTSTGLAGIYELLHAERASLEEAMRLSDDFQDLVTQYVKTYFKSFHIRWPILHAPTFDPTDIPLITAASVCVIGAWLQSTSRQSERIYALKVHEILLQRLLDDLVDPRSVVEGRPWPLDLFHAALLTLIFSFYRSDKGVLSRAMLLRSTLITLLREIGAFDAESFADHLRTHFSGTFAPYTLSMREKFGRLVTTTYLFDACFALVHEKPPILHRQEISVDMPSTFAPWNAYGLDIFASRLPEEPPGRPEFQVSRMMNCPSSFTSSQLLPEDIQLGLCGLLQATWVFKRSVPPEMDGSFGSASQSARLINKLETWKYELDKICELAATENLNSNATRRFLLAYRGEDDSIEASLDRMATVVQDGMILYHYLKIHCYVVTNGVALVEGNGTSTPEIWWTSQYGRGAFVCALQLLKTVDPAKDSKASLNHLLRYALALGLKVVRGVVSCLECKCFTAGRQHIANMNAQQWIETGGAAWIDGMLLCECELENWMELFDKAIQNQQVTAEPHDRPRSS